MSEENVSGAYRLIEEFNRRDLEAFLDLMAPDVEFISRIIRVGGEGPHRGYEGIREWWRDMLATFPDFRVEVLGVRDLGQTLIVSARVGGRGVGSDAPFEMRIWLGNGWRDGKLVWWQTFDSEAEALEAAGLSE